MVEIPPHLRLVATQGQRRTISATRTTISGKQTPSAVDCIKISAPRPTLVGDSCKLRAKLDWNGDRGWEDYSNPDLARKALDDLSWQLPELGQGVHELHTNLNRDHVLALLAPLMENEPIS